MISGDQHSHDDMTNQLTQRIIFKIFTHLIKYTAGDDI